MLGLDSQTIPAWFVAAMMILAGLMWVLCLKRGIRVDTRIFAITFIIQGLIYGIIYQFFALDVEFRGFMSRMIMVVLSLSQSLPLAVAYLRSRQ